MGMGIKAFAVAGAVMALISADFAAAQQITAIGDVAGATAGLLVSPVNSTNTQPFSYVSAMGTIVGDVIVTNNLTGTAFDLTITNLTYTCTVPNSANAGDVTVQVQHHYTTGAPGPYVGAQSLSGSWTSGVNSAVQLDGTHGLGVPTVLMPSLTALVSPFALGPATAVVPAGTPTQYVIDVSLRLHADGTGSINLPSSAHVSVNLVPEPAVLATLVAPVALLMRRRRR